MDDQVVSEIGDLNEDVDEEECFFQDIGILQEQGINVADIKKLKASGICTIRGVQMTTKKKLASLKGFSEAKVDKIKEAVSKIINAGAAETGFFVTALQASEMRQAVFRISTGSTALE